MAAVLLAVTGGSGHAVGPSFDCNTERAPTAQFICASPDLSRADLEFVQAYYSLRQQVGPSGWQALKRENLDSQHRTDVQCGIAPSGALPPDTAALATCLRQGYTTQRSLWLTRLSGAALEEARRPVEQHVALQRNLQGQGFLQPTATIDGVFGGATRSAILAWQRSRGLPETGFLGSADAEALAGQAGNGNPSSPPGVRDISSFSCKDIGGASQEALIPVVLAQIQYLRQHYPDLMKGADSEVIQQGKEVGAFVKAKCDQPGEQDAPLTSVLGAAARLMQAGQLEAWLARHQVSSAAPEQAPQASSADQSAQVKPAGGPVKSEAPQTAIQLPSRESGNYAAYCRDESTKRGQLDVAMFDYCVRMEDEGYDALVAAAQKYANIPWLQALIDDKSREWAKRGARRDSMGAYDVKLVIDAYLDMQYLENTPDYDKANAASCFQEYGDGSYPHWDMIEYCYKQNLTTPLVNRPAEPSGPTTSRPSAATEHASTSADVLGTEAQKENPCANVVLQAMALARAGGFDGCSLAKSFAPSCPCGPGTEAAILAARANAAQRQMFESCIAEQELEGRSEAEADTACGGPSK